MTGWAWGAFVWWLSPGGVLAPVWAVFGRTCLLAPFDCDMRWYADPTILDGGTTWVYMARYTYLTPILPRT